MAKPKLCLIPATIGDKVYSILPSDGVGDFDFTRADGSSPTGVTRINAQGLIEEVAIGKNRLNYSLLDGEVVGCPHLLLEPSRINVLSYSEQFDNSSWGKARLSISANQVISPDGTLNADYIEQQSGNTAAGGVFKFVTFLASTYTQSVFVKKKEKGFIALAENASSPSLRYTWFDVENGLIGTVNGGHTAKIEDYGNGWYRCSIIYTAINTGSGFSAFYYLSDTDNSTIVTGSGGLYLWGSMLEQGSYPTSYIKTTSAAVTRAAETCNGSGNAATFNDSEGVLMAEISALDNDSENKFISISNGSNTETLRIAYISGTDIRLETSMTSGTNFQKDIEINLSDNNKVCFQYKSNEYKVFVNGFSYSVTQRLTTPTGLNELSFHRGDGERNFYGKTKQLQYFDSALSDTELEQLTSWDSFRAMAQAQSYTIQ